MGAKKIHFFWEAIRRGQLTPNFELNSKIQTSVGKPKTLGGVGAKTESIFFWEAHIGRGVPVICHSNARFVFGHVSIQSTYTPTEN